MTRPVALAPALAACFDVRAARDPSVPCRVLGYFAQLGMTPSRVQIRSAEDEIRLRVTQPDLGEHAAEVIAEKLRAQLLVRAVRLEHHVGPAASAS